MAAVKLDKKQIITENILYAMVWTVVFLVPILNSKLMAEEHVNLDGIIIAWCKIAPYFIIFLIHNIFIAPALLRHIVEKGSIAIDGISLTVATVAADRFSVSVIPHTAAVTVLGRKRPGDIVNLETDLIGKYVEKLLRPTADSAPRNSSISLEFLTENGF